MDRNIKDWQKAFKKGRFDSDGAQYDAGWYDWFCKDTSLKNKTKRLGSIIKQIKDGGKVDLDKNYVWFKNNCPLCGPLYDAIMLADMETKEVLMNISCNDTREKSKYVVYSRENNFEKPVAQFNESRELVKWLNTK